jgi:hypothetical protein
MGRNAIHDTVRAIMNRQEKVLRFRHPTGGEIGGFCGSLRFLKRGKYIDMPGRSSRTANTIHNRRFLAFPVFSRYHIPTE